MSGKQPHIKLQHIQTEINQAPHFDCSFLVYTKIWIGVFGVQSWLLILSDSSFKLNIQMEQQLKVSNLDEQVQLLLKCMARQTASQSSPLVLRMSYQNCLKVEDSTGKKWDVDETYIDIFAHIYKNQAFKIVRLAQWRLQLKFNGKVCTKIDIIAPQVQFYSRQEVKRLNACHFTFTFVETPEEFQSFTQKTKGFLNRLGKRELCSISTNIHKRIKSLIHFAKKLPKPQPLPFKYTPWKPKKQQLPPATELLTTEGLAALEKLRHFVKTDQIINFVTERRLSEECTIHIKQMLAKKYQSQNQEQLSNQTKEQSIK